MHQYRVQYSRVLNGIVLAEIVIKDDRAKQAFVDNVGRSGFWIDEKTWIGPGCIQSVQVIA